MRIQRAAVGLGLTSALVLGTAGLAVGLAATTPTAAPTAAPTVPVAAPAAPTDDGLLGGVLELEDEDTDVDERFGTDPDDSDGSDGSDVLEVGNISVILEGVEVLGLDLGSDREDRNDDGVLGVVLERLLGDGLLGGD